MGRRHQTVSEGTPDALYRKIIRRKVLSGCISFGGERGKRGELAGLSVQNIL